MRADCLSRTTAFDVAGTDTHESGPWGESSVPEITDFGLQARKPEEPRSLDSDRYKFANFVNAQPVFCCFLPSASRKVIFVTLC